jgi:hypothetical protein
MSMSVFPGTQNLRKFPQQWLNEWDFEATTSSPKDKDKLNNKQAKLCNWVCRTMLHSVEALHDFLKANCI